MRDDRVKDLFRLQDLELVLDEGRIVIGVALGLEELHLALRLLHADLGGGQVPLGQQGGHPEGRQDNEGENDENEGLAQSE